MTIDAEELGRWREAHRHLAVFEKEHGRLPNLLELVMLREAIASVNIDRGDDVGTYVVEGWEAQG